ncbi:MAG: ECF transporter S component [Corynebacterium sp.]|nr:ECF transporter S component [Corynebacterium sp.]
MRSIVQIRPFTVLFFGLLAVVSAIVFLWPLFISPSSALADDAAAPVYFAVIIPLVIAAIVAEINEDGMDVRALAMLGVLSAVVAAVRPLGAGAAGFEAVFFVIILGGRAYGPGFGFLLGNIGLFASALLTAGIGPWLPYQMLAAGWVGLGAGLLPTWPALHRAGATENRWIRPGGIGELLLIVAYAIVAALAYGFVMNMSFWPYRLGAITELSYIPGAPVVENLHSFLIFSITTSLAWDLGRAFFTSVLLILTSTPVLGALRRAGRKAAFGTARGFTEADATLGEARTH